MRGLASAAPRARVLTMVLAALALAGTAPSELAGAVGPAISLSVGPQSVTAQVGPGESGAANFTGAVELYSNPVGAATLNVAITSLLGWTVAPPGFSWRVSSAGHYPFAFTVEVPPDATADLTDNINVVASYRVGGVTTQSESATVHAVAGAYFGGSARRITPPVTMEVGKNYVIEFDLRNDGNAPATFIFTWTDPVLNGKTRAALVLPQSLTMPGFGNESVQFSVTPQATTPGGHFALPARVDLQDRTGQVKAAVNLTVEVDFVNAPIFQGILPNWNLQGPYTLLVFAFLFLLAWAGFQVGVALLRVPWMDKKAGARFPRALRAGVRGSLLVRGARRLIGATAALLRRGPARARRLKRPAEIRAAASVRAGRPR